MAARLQLTSITIGAPNPRKLAHFYARLLNGEITAEEHSREEEPEQAGWAQVRTSSDFGSITLNFEWESEWRPIVWPSQEQQQHITQHLDILVDDLSEAVVWAVDCGATLSRHQPQDSVRVMIDPAGHPFCLFTASEEAS